MLYLYKEGAEMDLVRRRKMAAKNPAGIAKRAYIAGKPANRSEGDSVVSRRSVRIPREDGSVVVCREVRIRRKDGSVIIRREDGRGLVFETNISKAKRVVSNVSPVKGVQYRPRVEPPKTERHGEETGQIVSRIAGWAGGKEQALAWFRTQPISAFGDQTAEAMVKAGKAGLVRDYLDGIALGGFA